MGETGIKALADALLLNTTLQKLYLKVTPMVYEARDHLKQALQQNPFIKISCGYNEIRDLCTPEAQQIRLQNYKRGKTTKSSK